MMQCHRYLFVVLLTVISMGYSVETDGTPCLSPITGKQDVNTEFYLSVVEMATDSVPDIQKGDKLIGVDGYRISIMDEYRWLQSKGLAYNKAFRLTVIRDGRIMSIQVEDCLPARKLGGYLQQSADSASLLSRFGLSPEALVKNTIGADPQNYDLSALNRFPGVCQRELARLAAGTKEQKSWGNGFLKLFAFMCFEKYPDALVTGKKLLATAQGVDPLVVRIVQYYCKIAEHPPEEDLFPLEEYGVPREFAAFYYPFPVLQVKRLTNVFPNDPGGQKALEAKLYGGPDGERAAIIESYKGDIPDGFAEGYLERVKLAILNPKRHGGWPHRHTDVYNRSSRRKMLSLLRKRFEEKPEDRFITSLGLVVVGILQNGTKDVGQGMTYLGTLGVEEMRIMSNIVVNAYFSSSRNKLREVCQEYFNTQNDMLQKNISVPPVYRYLMKYCPYFHYRGMNSLFGMADGMGYTAIPDYADAIAPFLGSSISCQEMERVIEEGMSTLDTKTQETAFRYSTLRLCALPYPYEWQNEVMIHLILADAMPIRAVFNSYVDIVTAHLFRGIRTVEYFKITDCFDYLQKRDKSNLKFFAEIDQWKDDGTLANRAADFFDKNGSPLICLKLHEKLKRAGQTVAARRYIGFANNYYLGTKNLYTHFFTFLGPDFNMAYRFFPDLCAVGETGALIQKFCDTEHLKSESYAIPVAVNAFALADQQNWARAISELERAFTLPPLDNLRKCPPICFNGKYYSPSNHSFPEALAQSWLENPILSEENKNEIKLILSKWEAVKSQKGGEVISHQLIAVPTRETPVIDGNLQEWDLSGQVVVTADNRFSGNKRSQIALTYDDQFLYLGFHHADTSPMDNHHKYYDSNSQYGDSVILRYVCGERSGSILSWYFRSWNSRDQDDIIMKYEKGRDRNSPIGGGDPKVMLKSNRMAPEDCAFKKDPDKRGYTQEIRIPWKTFTGNDSKPEVPFRMCIGLNYFHIYSGSTLYTNFHEGVTPRRDTWKKTENYGEIILSPNGNLKKISGSLAPQPSPGKLPNVREINMPGDKVIGVEYSLTKKAFIIAKANGVIESWPYGAGTAKFRLNAKQEKKAKSFASYDKGQLYAISQGAGVIAIWNDKSAITLLDGHKSLVFSMDFSADGKYMLSAGADNLVVMWDLTTGKKTKQWTIKSSGRCVRFSGDGKQFSVGALNGNIYLFNVQDDKPQKVMNDHTFSIRSLCFSEGGKTLVSASDDMSLIVWDTMTGEKIKVLSSHTAPVSGVCFINKNTLLTASYDGTLREWDLQTGGVTVRYKNASAIKYLAYDKSSDGIAITTMDNSLVLVGRERKK